MVSPTMLCAALSNRWRLATVSALLLLSAHSPGRADEEKLPLVAVYPPIVTPAARAEVDRLKIDPQEVARQTEEALRGSRRFAIYERSAEVLTDSVLTEQRLARSGLAKENAAEFGKLDNVQLIVQPEITALAIGSKYAPLSDFPGRYHRADAAHLTITYKVLGTTSGEIKFQTTQTSAFDRTGGVSDGTSQHIGAEAFPALAHEVSIKATNAIVNYVYPIQVIRVTGNEIYVNRGEGGSLALGDVWELESTGESLIDPTTKEDLGSSETPLGKVRITRIAPRFSVAAAVGKISGEIKVGDVLRPVSADLK